MQKLTIETQEAIKKSFYNLLDRKLEDYLYNYDYDPFGDTYAASSSSYSDRDLESASEFAIEEFENNFNDYNNSTWVDPESVNYEQEKELIINYVKTL